MITLLNTSIVTAYGIYDYRQITTEDAKEAVQIRGCNRCYIPGSQYREINCPDCDGTGEIVNFKSAIGHESTAEILTELLNVKVEVNRQNYIQQPKESALVFKLKTRAPEGKILSREEIETIGYEFGLLTRIE